MDSYFRTRQFKIPKDGYTFPLYTLQGNQVNKENDKGASNYILLRGIHYFEISPQAKVLSYFGASLGAGHVEAPLNGTKANYAWEFKTGAKIKTSSAISINLQAYLSL